MEPSALHSQNPIGITLFFAPLRGDPLDEEAQAEDDAPGETDDFPRVQGDVQKGGRGERVQEHSYKGNGSTEVEE